MKDRTHLLGSPQPRMRDGYNDTNPDTVSPAQRRRSRHVQLGLAASVPVLAWVLSQNPSPERARFITTRADQPSSAQAHSSKRVAHPKSETGTSSATAEKPSEAEVRAKINAYNQKYAEAKDRLRRAGTFIIVSSNSTAEYVLCSGIKTYTVASGDAVESIARRHTVHYQAEGMRQLLYFTDIIHSIADANPDTSYEASSRYLEGGNLKVGEALKVPIDGACSGVASENGLYEAAGMPVPERDW